MSHLPLLLLFIRHCWIFFIESVYKYGWKEVFKHTSSKAWWWSFHNLRPNEIRTELAVYSRWLREQLFFCQLLKRFWPTGTWGGAITHAIDSMSNPPFLIGHQTVIIFPWIPILGISRLKSNRAVSARSDHGDLGESTILHRRENSLQVDTNLDRLRLNRLRHRHHTHEAATDHRYDSRSAPITDWVTAAIALTILAIRIGGRIAHGCCFSSSGHMKLIEMLMKKQWWTRRNRTIVLTSKLILSIHIDVQSFDTCGCCCCCCRCCFSLHSFDLGFPDPALLLTFLFLRFENEFLPETSDLVEFSDGPSGGTEGISKGSLFLNKVGMLSFKCFFLLNSLSVQNGKTELKLANLTIIALALLVKAVILGAQFS